MWREVDAIVKDGRLFATNTSSLAVLDQAAVTGAPGPLPRPALLQPGAGDAAARGRPTVTTSDEALKTRLRGRREARQDHVHARDKTGFIVNRLLVPYMLDAIRAYEEGVGSIEESTRR